MANALTKIQKGADKRRKKLAGKGFRECTVTLRRYTTAAGDENTDLGVIADEATPDDLLIDPPPKVESVSLRLIEHGAGVVEMGDLKISEITRTSEAVDARLRDPAVIFVVTGLGLDGEYSIVGGQLTTKTSEHVAIVRKVAERA